MIAFLTIVAFLLIVIEIVLSAIVVLVILDMIISQIKGSRRVDITPAAKTKEAVKKMLDKERLRRQKEAEAHEGFFEESYVRGFDSSGALFSRVYKTPTSEAMAYYKTMDDLTDKVNDAQIFDNTKDL